MFQAAVYGLGVCAEFGGSTFRPRVGGSLLPICMVACLPGLLLGCDVLSYLVFLQRLFPGWMLL